MVGFNAGEDDKGTPAEQSTAKTPKINVNFPKVVVGMSVKKYFEVVNCGETMVDIVISTIEGMELEPGCEMATDKVLYKMDPSLAVIQPKTKQKFTVTLKGLKPGDEAFTLQVRTRTLTEVKCIPILVKARIFSADSLLGDSIKTFARADTNFETIVDMGAQEEMRFSSERNLWKILLPIERVGPLLPSMEMGTIPYAEPNLVLPDVSTYVIRPPAIPKDLPPRAKKWYMNRVSMALDQAKARAAGGEERDAERRQEALEFVKPVEKRVYLEKKNYRAL
ncbi:hypothetical protein HK101_006315 [Irineochytrium annulatum]|nr:hypothetical protein HK101_006315 [Irineochytrium annulatum]